jgi:uncharacterized protein YndB with AHSA1/START domain
MAANRTEVNSGGLPMFHEIEIVRIFDAPREAVFEAWVNPKHLAKWFGPKYFTNPVCEVDLRVGGAWRIVMRGPDGTDYPCGGKYLEIVRPERLVFTNIATDAEGKPILDGLTTVIFEEAVTKTKLTLRTKATAVVDYAAAYLQGMEAGWSQSLDVLAEELGKA